MSTLTERHFTVKEIAINLNISRDTVRRRFLCEDGVIILSRPRKGTRIYRLLLIPESVALRVYARLQNRGAA